MELTGKTAIVTGSAKGIGLAIAEVFAREGASVTLADVDKAEVENVAAGLESRGFSALGLNVDVTSADDIKRMVAQTKARFGAVDCLVNCAGGGSTTLIEDTSEAEWRKVVDLNLTSTFLCCQAVMGEMKARRYGKIVNISSVAARRIGIYGGAHYTAAKAGVLGFTRQLAFELSPWGINVNAVCPGPTMTPLIRRVTTEAQRAEMVKRIPLGRWAEPEDQANAVLFLCSDRAAMITGQTMDVDGGALIAWMDYESYVKGKR